MKKALKIAIKALAINCEKRTAYAKTTRGRYIQLSLINADSEELSILLDSYYKLYPRLYAALVRSYDEEQAYAWEAHGERMVGA